MQVRSTTPPSPVSTSKCLTSPKLIATGPRSRTHRNCGVFTHGCQPVPVWRQTLPWFSQLTGRLKREPKHDHMYHVHRGWSSTPVPASSPADVRSVNPSGRSVVRGFYQTLHAPQSVRQDMSLISARQHHMPLWTSCSMPDHPLSHSQHTAHHTNPAHDTSPLSQSQSNSTPYGHLDHLIEFRKLECQTCCDQSPGPVGALALFGLILSILVDLR